MLAPLVTKRAQLSDILLRATICGTEVHLCFDLSYLSIRLSLIRCMKFPKIRHVIKELGSITNQAIGRCILAQHDARSGVEMLLVT